MRPYVLAESNWKYIKDAQFEAAVLPWGACEAHNYHLPYGTDNIEADHVAAESARVAWELGARPIVLPTIPFGVNTGQPDIALDINMNPSTQLAVLDDIVAVLNRQQIHRLIILNSHGGNDFKPMIRELGLKYPSMFLCACNWFQALDQKAYFENKDDHAGEMETSMILHLRPDLVRPLNEAGDGKARKFGIAAIREGWAWAERKWSRVTADTGVGDPRKATAEKGARYFSDLTTKVGRFFYDVCKTNRDELYE
jgi:creatinine amidohydrolase